jgi:hypothetical protein
MVRRNLGMQWRTRLVDMYKLRVSSKDLQVEKWSEGLALEIKTTVLGTVLWHCPPESGRGY